MPAVRVDWWVSSSKLTAWVETTADGHITDTAPVVRKFVGQHLLDLFMWMRGQGEFRMEVL